jgi:MFS family permease
MTAPPARGTFRSLANRNFRLWIVSGLLSNIGSWMQGTAQTWLVLTELTDHSAAAVGIVTALQFTPQLLLVAVTGTAADHVDRRKLLIAIQCGMAVLALALGLATVSGVVQLWHVYVLAFLLGCGMAFDMPARNSFISELVGEGDIGNAVALNGTAFQLARAIGPAIAGLLIALVGTGWVFIINGLCYAFIIGGLMRIHVPDLHRHAPGERGKARLLDGFRYVRHRPDIRAVFTMLFFMGMLGMNFAVFVSVMSVAVFHKGAGEYGLLTSLLAVGSVIGALLAARRDRPRLFHLIGGAFCFGCTMMLAAAAPNYLLFSFMMVLIGLSTQTLMTSANGFVQLATERAMRGRVIAIHMAILLGGLPIGAPFVGWVADHLGPRTSMLVGGSAGFVATAIGLVYLVRERQLRLYRENGRWRYSVAPDPYRPAGLP